MATVTISPLSLIKAISTGLHASNEQRLVKLALEHMEVTRRKQALESQIKDALAERGRLNQILEAAQ